MTAERPKTSTDRLSDLFRTQRGLVTRAQALESGLSTSAISRSLTSGKWARSATGVYRLAGVPTSWEQSVLAACLAGGEGTVASHECAAALHGLDDATRAQVEIWSPRRLRLEGPIVHLARLPSADTTRASGIPVTSMERTLMDLATTRQVDSLEAALDSALRQRKTSIARLRWRLQQAPKHGAKGIGSLRRLVEARATCSATSESALEVRLVQIIRRAGLPTPDPQFRVLDGRRVIGRFDFAYPDSKLIIEIDGYRWHSGNAAWQRDRRRDNDLNRLGWTVLRFTADDLRDPPGVLRQIRAVLYPSLDV